MKHSVPTSCLTILAITAIVITELIVCHNWQTGWLFVFFGVYKIVLKLIED
jgi:hypothetical protein